MKAAAIQRLVAVGVWWLLAAFCIARSQGALAEDALDGWDLFDIDRQHSIGVRIGNSDSLSWGADIALMLPGNTELTADYLQTDFSVLESGEKLASYSIGFSTDPLARWSGQLVFEHSGEADSLQTEDIGLGVQYRAQRWQLGLRYLVGEVDLRTTPIANQLQPRRYNLNRNALDAALAVLGERWQWSARYLDYRYERSINVSPTSLVLLRRLGFNTFQQVFGLVDWTASTEFGYHRGAHSWRLGYSQHALELTDESGRIPYAAWDWAFSEQFSAGLMGAIGLDDSEHYAELSLRMRF